MLDRKSVIKAVDDYRAGDSQMLDCLVAMLKEHSDAKHILRQKGYGFTGKNLVMTAEEVPESDA